MFYLSEVSAPHGGEPKGRCVVVVTAKEDIGLDNPIFVVACTASVFPRNREVVDLPWDRRGSARTGFRRPTWAVPAWMLKVRPSQLGAKKGHVPHGKLAAIIELLPPEPSGDMTE